MEIPNFNEVQLTDATFMNCAFDAVSKKNPGVQGYLGFSLIGSSRSFVLFVLLFMGLGMEPRALHRLASVLPLSCSPSPTYILHLG
jgi:hypothetical protein